MRCGQTATSAPGRQCILAPTQQSGGDIGQFAAYVESRGRVKGIVFNLLSTIVVHEYGEDAWDDLLDSTGLNGAYTSLGNYPDEELMRLVDASPKALGLPDSAAVLRWFGRRAIPILAERYPNFFTPQKSTLPFLLTLNEIIHPEVRKIYPGADVPVFDFDTSSESVLVMGYRSKRKLCALAQGFAEGAADYYGEVLQFEHLKCMHDGADKCVFRISVS